MDIPHASIGTGRQYENPAQALDAVHGKYADPSFTQPIASRFPVLPLGPGKTPFKGAGSK